MGAIGVILIASFAIDRIVTREQANVEDAGNDHRSQAFRRRLGAREEIRPSDRDHRQTGAGAGKRCDGRQSANRRYRSEVSPGMIWRRSI
jgi:hypothetical protein